MPDDSRDDHPPLDDALPSTGLLSFYDRLRERVLAAAERRGGRAGGGLAQVLLLAPDVFMLLARLALDRDVPKPTRALVASTLAYFVVPIDLLPEAAAGVGGYVDDLILAAGVLSRALGGDLEALAEKHWSGPQPLRRTLRDVLAVASSLAGSDLYGRLRSRLARRGIDLDDAAGEEES